jgi:hypothetical protein
MDMDLDPVLAIFVIDLQEANKKLIFFEVFLHFSFSKIKSKKELTKQ